MQTIDYLVLVGYFVLMAGIGLWAMRRNKRQEDYFMGGRGFGKLLQTFAAFGAGTGSADPINTARTTFTSGVSGMWSVMYWLFVTPMYWISGVWYRRMRHLTLGDWFVERYESKALGVGYTLFGLLAYVVYTAMLFTAIGKFAAPLMNIEGVVMFGHPIPIENVLVVIVAVMVVLYGALGGLTAAYWTDLIQGICIIGLSILLIPTGLSAIVERFGEVYPNAGAFQIMHKELPSEFFTIVGSTSASQFPIYSIVAIVVLNMVGIAVWPHFIVTGGGSAKTEMNARVGLVAGNLLKRFCTVGWVLTALIAIVLFADHPDLVNDPDKTWGVASRELLGPGMLGLMLACLLAALMSSADAYMLVSSGLVVRNVYAAYINDKASERTYVNLGRVTGAVIIIGAVIVSLMVNDVFELLKITWEVPVAFAAPFWIGLFWRRATTAAVWVNVLFCVAVFLVIPLALPAVMPDLRDNATFAKTNDIVTTIATRKAAPSDVAKRRGAIKLWDEKTADVAILEQGKLPPSLKKQGDGDESVTSERIKKELAAAKAVLAKMAARPEPIKLGDELTETSTTGGKAIFWSGGVKPAKPQEGLPPVAPVEVDRTEEAGVTTIIKRYPDDAKLQGQGRFVPDYLLYDAVGVDLTGVSDAMLSTLSLVPKIVMPFLIVIVVSLVTRRNSVDVLDRYYVKMKTPVLPDPEADAEELEASYAEPHRFDHKKLFPGSDLEMQRPTLADVLGFVLTFAACFGVIALVVWLASIGSSL